LGDGGGVGGEPSGGQFGRGAVRAGDRAFEKNKKKKTNLRMLSRGAGRRKKRGKTFPEGQHRFFWGGKKTGFQLSGENIPP